MSDSDQNDATGSTSSNDDNAATTTTPLLFQTTVRQAITPYLPPPVIKAMRTIDPQLEPYVGPEGSITVVGSLLLAWMLLQVMKFVFGTVGGGGKAIQDSEEEEENLAAPAASSRQFDGTVLLCGPSMAGKTSLFGHLIQQQQNGGGGSSNDTIQTVRSIKSNTGFLETKSTAGDGAETWRIVDTPGHWGPEKLLQMIPLAQVQRILVVVDSTQPVAQAADYLFAIWTDEAAISSSSSDLPSIMIACHKSKHPKAKNMRRIKLQLRSELERISKLKAAADGSAAEKNWEQMLNETPICSSNVGEGGSVMDDVQQFCETGKSAASKR